MDLKQFETATIHPTGNMYYCRREEFKSNGLIMPGTAKNSPHLSYLVIEKVGPMCQYGEVGDVPLMKERAKIGSIMLHKELIMVSEDDVGLIIKFQKQEGENGVKSK